MRDAGYMYLHLEKYGSYVIGAVVSLGIFSGILLLMGFSPLLSFESIMYGSFGSTFSATETLIRVSPLLLTALAFLVAFKSRFFNIGVEGQLNMGALTAYLVAVQLGSLPGFLAIPLVAFAAIAGGVGWLAVPLVMRIKLGVNEVFPTLVMNFIAVLIISWLTTGPIKDPNAVNPQTVTIPGSTWLPLLIPGTRFHVGFFFALVLALMTFVVLYKTILGYEIRAAGLSPKAAKHGGVSLARSLASVGLLSGGLAGLAGMVEIAGTSHLLAQGFSPGFGYQGIGVAALGGFHPIGALLASILFAVLSIGGETMQRGAGVPIEIIYVLQATVVLSVLTVQRWISSRR
jgi:simple sugar transport system permease protein